MPWTVKNPPKVAKHWSQDEKRRCVQAANKVLKDTGDEGKAIRACIHSAGRTKHPGGKSSLSLATQSRAPLGLTPLPFAGAIASARSRGVVLPEVYYGELTGLARALAFTVSRLATIDQIDRVLQELTRNLEEGNTFADFKRSVETDPDMLSLPRGRVETIYRNGVQTAYNRGRAEFHIRHKATRPFLMYSGINDSRIRPAHLRMNGVIAPVDHPIWHRWYAPNGHQCRCSMISLTRADAERRGITVDFPDAEPDAGWAYSVMDDPSLALKDAAAAKRQSVAPSLADLVPDGPPPRLSLDEMVKRGAVVSERMFEELIAAMRPPGRPAVRLDDHEIRMTLQKALNDVLAAANRPTHTEVKIRNRGKGADLVKLASTYYPDTWITKSDELGPLRVMYDEGRVWQMTFAPGMEMQTVRLSQPFGVVRAEGGHGYITANNLDNALHEFAHRLQNAMPELDDYFQELHVRRTAGEAIEKLKDITRNDAYADYEEARRDAYISPYMGKEYKPSPRMYTGRAGALEMMPMTFDGILGMNTDKFLRLLREDRELFDLAVGLLMHYDP